MERPILKAQEAAPKQQRTFKACAKVLYRAINSRVPASEWPWTPGKGSAAEVGTLPKTLCFSIFARYLNQIIYSKSKTEAAAELYKCVTFRTRFERCAHTQEHCTMIPLSTRSCLKSNKLRPILNGQFCHAISKNNGLNLFGSKQPREILVFVILKL